ncbi:hypothetical protein O0L34_g5222 [Tuta absoluta]|nr:hypothetical protein O0L34_g5222 [Tuta absoluta]
MSFQVQKLTDPLVLGEGPHWDERVQALYFVDINSCTIHKYEPATGEHSRTKLDGRVGFIVPLESASDHFVVGVERKFLVIQWDGGNGTPAKVIKELAEVDLEQPTNRINDGKCDPRGRLYAGTMGKENPPGNFQKHAGSLFRLEGTKLTTLANRIGISNGLAWDVSRKAMYYTDSLEENIRRYDYNVETGEITNMKHIFDMKPIGGLPDGSTIDTDGNLWVACFNGSCVIKIDPSTGKLLQKVPIPAKQVTSVSFGGAKMDVLFVTTACMNIGGAQEPPCGATFMVSGLGAKGHPNANFKLQL